MNNTRIRVKVDDIHIGVPLKKRHWWNWGHYINSWKMLDENPHTPIEKLPLYDVMKRHFGSKNRGQAYIKSRVKLYFKVKREGFENQMHKHIIVTIGKNGIIGLDDGHNRISMIKHLGHPKHITVTVRARNTEWIKLKKRANSLYPQREKFLYQPIDHPDFADWKVARKCTDRLQAITRYVGDMKGKNVLDIGSCTGFFSHRLAQMDANVVGLEINENRLEIARRLSKCYGLPESNPLFRPTPFGTYLSGGRRFDFILFLSLLHHYMRRGIGNAAQALNKISEHTDLMFLDTSTVRLPVKWTPQFVVKHSRFTKYKRLKGDDSYSGGFPFYAYEK